MMGILQSKALAPDERREALEQVAWDTVSLLLPGYESTEELRAMPLSKYELAMKPVLDAARQEPDYEMVRSVILWPWAGGVLSPSAQKVPFPPDRPMSLDPEELDYIKTVGKTIICKPGDALCDLGQSATQILIVISGTLSVSDASTKLERVYTSGQPLGPGELLGWLEVMTGEPYQMKAIALEESLLVVIPASRFDEVLSGVPRLALWVIQRMARTTDPR